MTPGTVLVADDDAAIRTVVTQALTRAGYDVRAASNAASLWRWVSEGQGDVVLTDVVLPDESGFDVLPRIKAKRPRLPVIVMSARNTIMTAITASERGAYDYLPKPFDLSALVTTVGQALEDARKTDQPVPKQVAEESDALPIVGRSPAMQDIYRVVARMTQTDLTVMIQGESGTGKELVARALHDFSRRKAAPFIAMNMAAIPRELIESELFGHEKGAFTGAVSRYLGRFEQAHGGTLFLDEIGDMPMEAQTRLLRVLQEGEYTSVGGVRPIKTDVRIVAATHRDLNQLIAQGMFREDLFFRLNVVPLRLPPLRERADDIPDLINHFLRRNEMQGLPSKTFSAGAIDALRRGRWPGNIRELENFVSRLCAVHAGDEISAATIEQEFAIQNSPGGDKDPASYNSLSEFVENHMAQYFASFQPNLPPDGLYHRVIQQVEVPLINATLASTGGNQIKAANLLGINRNTLRTRIKELGLSVVKTPGARR
ncbi:MAG: nitrogen regulation protein NR(I) [Pseudomonadota bacterium]